MHLANCKYVRELAALEREEEPPEKAKRIWSEDDGPLFYDYEEGGFRIQLQEHDDRAYSLPEFIRAMNR